MYTVALMRLGVIDVGNTRTKRALFDGKKLRPLAGKVDRWIGVRVGKGSVPRGTLLLGRDFGQIGRASCRERVLRLV